MSPPGSQLVILGPYPDLLLRYPGKHLLCEGASYYTGHNAVSMIHPLCFRAVRINPGGLDHPTQPLFCSGTGVGAQGGADSSRSAWLHYTLCRGGTTKLLCLERTEF